MRPFGLRKGRLPKSKAAVLMVEICFIFMNYPVFLPILLMLFIP